MAKTRFVATQPLPSSPISGMLTAMFLNAACAKKDGREHRSSPLPRAISLGAAIRWRLIARERLKEVGWALCVVE